MAKNHMPFAAEDRSAERQSAPAEREVIVAWAVLIVGLLLALSGFALDHLVTITP